LAVRGSTGFIAYGKQLDQGRVDKIKVLALCMLLHMSFFSQLL
jgi:hypothetical protein